MIWASAGAQRQAKSAAHIAMLRRSIPAEYDAARAKFRGIHAVRQLLTPGTPVYGVLKLGLEVSLPLVRLARRGEAVRVGAVRDRPS